MSHSIQASRRATQNLTRRFLSQSFTSRQERSWNSAETDQRQTERFQASSGHGESSGDHERRHIHLTGLPRTAKPADLMRLARQAIKDDALAKNITQARLDYVRFHPTGRAYLTLRTPSYVTSVCRSFKDAQMSSLPVKAFVSPLRGAQRMRGKKGRQEAAERAIFDGNGIAGGLDAKGCDVVLSGLPGTIAAPALGRYLRRIGMVKLAANGEPDCEVIKVEPPKRRTFTAISKHLVRLNSPAEAHAFVRKMHLTFFLPEVWSQKYLVKAKVVY